MVRIGTAGWNVPKTAAGVLPAAGSHLQRYASRFQAVEINSSFYRPHRPATYARWAASVSDDFSFSVKVPKQITHELRLAVTAVHLQPFLQEAAGLGTKLGCLLVQLPPSLAFDNAISEAFFALLRGLTSTPIALEPRHPSWFASSADELLTRYHFARVAADPARVPAAAEPGGWKGLSYFRLHGSPQMYYSSYDDAWLDSLAARMRPAGQNVWCIFDNTAAGAALHNAMQLQERRSSLALERMGSGTSDEMDGL